jgi:hypothetical protein
LRLTFHANPANRLQIPAADKPVGVAVTAWNARHHYGGVVFEGCQLRRQLLGQNDNSHILGACKGIERDSSVPVAGGQEIQRASMFVSDPGPYDGEGIADQLASLALCHDDSVAFLAVELPRQSRHGFCLASKFARIGGMEVAGLAATRYYSRSCRNGLDSWALAHHRTAVGATKAQSLTARPLSLEIAAGWPCKGPGRRMPRGET